MNVKIIRFKAEKVEENEVENCNSIPIGVPDEPEEAEYELFRTRPSKYLKSFGLRTSLEESQANMRRGILLSESSTKTKFKFFRIKEKVEAVSVEDKARPYTEMERKTAKLEVIREESACKIDCEVSLEKFRELLRTLEDKFGFEIVFEMELRVPIRRKNRDRTSQLEYYDWKRIYEGKKPIRRRKFLLVIGRFSDINNLVSLLEIDQTGISYSLSTFIFVVKKQGIDSKLIKLLKKSVIYFLIKKSEGLQEEELKELMKSKGMEVYFKKHPSVWSNRAIINWCRRVKEVVVKLKNII